MKCIYPVIFTQTDDIVLIEVPDLGILTEGSDMLNAVEMARDAIGLKGITLEDRNQAIPEPSQIRQIDSNNGTFSKEGTSYVTLVDIDFTEYRKKIDTKAVRRNVTLPSWLNKEAEKAHINVSKVLQQALMEQLDISK